MTTSGTVSFDLDILEIIEEAYEIVGMDVRGGYDLKSARRSLDLLMREWANRGLNMWTLIPKAVPYTVNQDGLVLLDGLVDVLDVAWRTVSGDVTTDTTLNRFSGTMWMGMSNKRETAASPNQYFVERSQP